MARLDIVYTEKDKSVQLYRDCDIESICRSWLDKLTITIDTSLVYQFTTAQELVFKTMQMLLIRDFSHLTTDHVYFFIEDQHYLMNEDWHWADYPDCYPDYQSECLDIIWDI